MDYQTNRDKSWHWIDLRNQGFAIGAIQLLYLVLLLHIAHHQIAEFILGICL